jgi:hypothetical protein
MPLQAQQLVLVKCKLVQAAAALKGRQESCCEGEQLQQLQAAQNVGHSGHVLGKA